MENENKLENMDQVQTENSALQGPISLPETDSAGSGPVIEIDSPSVDPTPMVEVQPVETPAVEPTPEVVEAIEPVVPTSVLEPPVIEEPAPTVVEPTIPTSVEEVQPAVETPVVESTPAIETPAVEAAGVAPEAPAVMEEPAASNVEQLETLAPPTVDSTDAFQAQSVPNQPEPTPAPALDPSLNVQQIAPALDEIAAENAPKKKSKKGIIFILLLIVAVIAAVVVYKFVILKPNKAYGQVFNVYKEKVGKALDLTIAPINNSILETGDITLETNYEELKDFNNLNIGYRFGIDYDHKKIELTTNIKENDKEVLKTIVYLVNNKIYLSSEQIFSKMLLLGDFDGTFDMNDVFENVKTTDIAYAVKSLGNHFISALDYADYSSKDTKISIGGKNTLVTDNIMIINDKNIDTILKSFLKSIKNDTKLLEVLANISEIDQAEISSYIDSYVAEDHKYEADEVKVHVYTKYFTTQVVSIKVSVTDNGTPKDIISVIFDKKNIEIITDYYKVSAKSTDGKNYDVTVYEQEQELFNCKLTINDNNKYAFETTISGYTVKASYEINKEESDHIIKANVEISRDSTYLKVSLNNKIQYNVELGDAKVSSAVDVNKLSSDDQTKIEKNIKKLMNNSKVINSFLTITGYKSLIETSTNSKTSKTLTEMCNEKDTICSKCTGNSCECIYHDMLPDAKTIYCPRNY